MTEENAVKDDDENIKAENDVQTDVKAKTQTEQKKTPKRKAKAQSTKNKLTEETFNLMQKRNKEEGIPIRELCEVFNVAYSSFNTKKKNKDLAANQQTQSPKMKNSSKLPQPQSQPAELDKTSEIESQLILLKEMYMDLLLKHNQLLKEK